MKGLLLVIFLFAETQLWAGFKVVNEDVFSGSWINNKVCEYFESGKDHKCENNFFGSKDFVPLYLSFKEKNKLEITFRYEQKKGIYDLKSATSNSIIAYKGIHNIKIKLVNNSLEIEFEGRLHSFKRVSASYSKDVFGEFVKGLIFQNFENYRLVSFSESKNFDNKIFDRKNFLQALNEIFRGNAVRVAELGVFPFKELCLTKILIYYPDKENKWPGPRALGIKIEENSIKFIDASGGEVLILKNDR